MGTHDGVVTGRPQFRHPHVLGCPGGGGILLASSTHGEICEPQNRSCHYKMCSRRKHKKPGNWWKLDESSSTKCFRQKVAPSNLPLQNVNGQIARLRIKRSRKHYKMLSKKIWWYYTMKKIYTLLQTGDPCHTQSYRLKPPNCFVQHTRATVLYSKLPGDRICKIN